MSYEFSSFCCCFSYWYFKSRRFNWTFWRPYMCADGLVYFGSIHTCACKFCGKQVELTAITLEKLLDRGSIKFTTDPNYDRDVRALARKEGKSPTYIHWRNSCSDLY